MTQNKSSKRPGAWTHAEDIATIRDYLDLLDAHQRGEKVNKAAARRELVKRLNNRSEASVEFKRMNISAVLAQMGRDYLPGYKPATNYQRSLADAVMAELERREGKR